MNTPTTQPNTTSDRAGFAPLSGIHHITTFASDHQANADFYTKVLGLRLVKVTVNFDDPSTYHLYFGDEAGSPGTILTFFPIIGAARGRRGTGEVTATSFAVPAGSLGYWRTRLATLNVRTGEPHRRFGQEVLTFTDGDGTDLELIETGVPIAKATGQTNSRTDVPASAAITGFFGATLRVASSSRTAQLLTDLFGFQRVGTEGDRTRFAAPGTDAVPGRHLDLVQVAAPSAGSRPIVGAGSVHHIALRVPDDASQAALSKRLTAAGYHITEQRDRCYFRSMYFRETGGVLFELATDGPGFATDESPDALGTALKLPHWLERNRSEIVDELPRLSSITNYTQVK